MSIRPDNLLQDAGRFKELVIGYICAAISVLSAALLVWSIYLVAWRNPREHGVDDLFKVSTLLIFSLFLIIAFGFSVFAFRLIARKNRTQGLISPPFLRIWGTFFGIGSFVVLIDFIANKRWIEAWHSWTVFPVSVSMAVAAFVLARNRGSAPKNDSGDN
jgi:hypothetical protein